MRVLMLAVMATLLLGLVTITNQASAAAVDKVESNNPKTDTEDQSEAATNGNGLFTSFDPSDLVHHYTSEEINRNRLMSMGRNGVEYVQTDAEVILEKIQIDESSSGPTYPHYSVTEELKGHAKRKREIIGYDDLYPASYPNCAIGQLSNGCTAFLIGPYHAITAGHCVYNCSTKTWTNDTDLDLYIGRDCNTPGRQLRFVRAWTGNETKDCEPNIQNVDYDIAWILYDSQDPADCWSSIGWRTAFPFPLRICGYPYDKTGLYNCLYCSWCINAQMRPGDMAIDHTCDTQPGMDGSPIFTLYSSSTRTFEYAVGVNSQFLADKSGNLGTLITKDRYEWTLDWMCDTGHCPSVVNDTVHMD